MSADLFGFADDMTVCPICVDCIVDPRSLPCLRTFCLLCLRSIYRNRQSGDSVPCPLCRTRFPIPVGGVDSLPRNFVIGGLASIRKEQRGNCALICVGCGDPAQSGLTVYCHNCHQQFRRRWDACDRCGGETALKPTSYCDKCCEELKQIRVWGLKPRSKRERGANVTSVLKDCGIADAIETLDVPSSPTGYNSKSCCTETHSQMKRGTCDACGNTQDSLKSSSLCCGCRERINDAVQPLQRRERGGLLATLCDLSIASKMKATRKSYCVNE